MGSPITLSGFNNIDWNSVLNALMQQESQPLTVLQSQQSDITAQQTAFSTFASKLGTLQSAVQDLTQGASFNGRAVSSSNTGALTASAGNNTPIGTYEVRRNGAVEGLPMALYRLQGDRFEFVRTLF